MRNDNPHKQSPRVYLSGEHTEAINLARLVIERRLTLAERYHQHRRARALSGVLAKLEAAVCSGSRHPFLC